MSGGREQHDGERYPAMEGIRPLVAGDPERIGPYPLLGRLRAGGMGRVYLARSAGGRTVAVRVVHEEHISNGEFRARFRREIEAARRVGGRYTAPVLDADADADHPWVATGYVPGPSLEQAVREHGPLPAESVHALAEGLLRARRGIHAAGIVHRDLKPSNVLLTVDGPRVIDFGIARALQGKDGKDGKGQEEEKGKDGDAGADEAAGSGSGRAAAPGGSGSGSGSSSSSGSGSDGGTQPGSGSSDNGGSGTGSNSGSSSVSGSGTDPKPPARGPDPPAADNRVPQHFVGTWSIASQYALQPHTVVIRRASPGQVAVTLVADVQGTGHCEYAATLSSVSNGGQRINVGTATVDKARSTGMCRDTDPSFFAVDGSGILHDVGPAHGSGYRYNRA
ncbi:serine/threonine-protein kinase [Streptomyces cyaneofuscatus]|uniref:serine/threonine-protein kinase n=1 Tax=Streptomyces cyaneofuscatus TaxID=66883 RepID=UPI0036CFCA61